MKLGSANGIDALLRTEDKHIEKARASWIRLWDPAQSWSRGGRAKAPSGPSSSIRQPETPHAIGAGLLRKAGGLIAKRGTEAIALEVRTTATKLETLMTELELAEGRTPPVPLFDGPALGDGASDEAAASHGTKRSNS
jgi:hypothetical protein